MSVGLFLLLIVAGGLGAVTRYVLDGLIRARTGSKGFPWPTTIINVTGAFVLGLVTGLAVARIADTDVVAIVCTGFLGGYTTFSTASWETIQLVRKQKYGLALAYGIGVLVVTVLVALAGYTWGKSI